jgi:CRISPR-associated protein Csd2
MSRVCAANENKPEQFGLGPRKAIVPYALYRAEGYISASLGQQTGFTEDDLKLLWDSLINMFDHDHSAARGKMCARKLIVFKHDSKLGNAPAHKLFDTVTVQPCEGKPPRSFNDYTDGMKVPANGPLGGFPGVTVMSLL